MKCVYFKAKINFNIDFLMNVLVIINSELKNKLFSIQYNILNSKKANY